MERRKRCVQAGAIVVTIAPRAPRPRRCTSARLATIAPRAPRPRRCTRRQPVQLDSIVHLGQRWRIHASQGITDRHLAKRSLPVPVRARLATIAPRAPRPRRCTRRQPAQLVSTARLVQLPRTHAQQVITDHQLAKRLLRVRACARLATIIIIAPRAPRPRRCTRRQPVHLDSIAFLGQRSEPMPRMALRIFIWPNVTDVFGGVRV